MNRWAVTISGVTRTHYLLCGKLVVVVHATHTHAPWAFHVLPWSVWVEVEKDPWRAAEAALRSGGAATWQRARKLGERAEKALRGER
jgi:hypothetical protein